MSQKFYAAPRTRFEFKNGAVGYSPSGPMDCIGPFAKVENCPIAGTKLRRTCYASGHADTFFSVPANTKVAGKHIAGFFTIDDGECVFNVVERHWFRIPKEDQA